MIKVLVDSASDIVEEEAKELGIYMIPLEVTIDGVTYLDGVNLSHIDFFKKLIETSDFPKTSQINQFRFEEKLEELTKDGSTVLIITISDKLSGTYNQAVLASHNFKNVYVLNSKNLCVGERILIEYALALIKKGWNIEDIMSELERKKKYIRLVALFDTIEYLRRGGRISRIAALAAYTLRIKPVIDVVNGEIKIAGKALGSKNGKNYLNKLILESNGIDFDMPYVTGHSCFDTTVLDKYIEDSKDLYEGHVDTIRKYMIGSTIGTHVGPGAIAVAFFEKETKGEIYGKK